MTDGPMTPFSMTRRTSLFLALLACNASLILGALLEYELGDAKGRFTGHLRSLYIDVDSQAKGFTTFVDRWNRYVIAHDGYIRADPYRGLIDDGAFGSYAELRGIVFNRCLPPRINPDLAQNPKRVILWVDRSDLDEMWTVFADGSWARLTYAQSNAADDDWCAVLRSAGYPRWQSLPDKDKWTARNKGRLIWDAARRIFIVGPASGNPASRPARSASG